MLILGIHIGHDSCAAIIRNGRIIADVAEERFNRQKHYSGMPIEAVQYCLQAAGCSINDIDAIAVPGKYGVPELNFLLGLKGHRTEKASLGKQASDFVRKVSGRSMQKPPLYIKSYDLPANIPIIHVDHHLSHAASAYYTCPSQQRQLIITMDGAGDEYSICLWRGEAGKITPLEKFDTSASLGWFYSNVTEALGWWHGDGEGKTMGLAPYGDRNKARGSLSNLHPVFEDGELKKRHKYGRQFIWQDSGALQFHYDEAYLISEIIRKHGRENVAAEAQCILEEQAAQIIYPWLRRENTNELCCAGGIFLNVKLNQRIWESGKVTSQHIFPNSGDCGLAVGAALHVFYSNNPDTERTALDHLYFGPEYSNESIQAILESRKLPVKQIDCPEEYAARLLSQDKIVAWFQGRMESGPRALGNRSILMSPINPANKDTINAKVKFREAFRPFCPSILWEKKKEYLEKARDEFFMITSFTCKDSKVAGIPAVVHADRTLRPQTVKKSFNSTYWNLINHFGNLTGEYCLLNTSFNVMGEPIVCSPREAIRCFYDNGLDCLIMNNFALEKNS